MREEPVGDTLALKVCGRPILQSDVTAIVELVESCPGLSRNELAHTVCEHMTWVTVTGRHKVTACVNLLERLEGEGRLQLPEKYKQRRRPGKQVALTERTDEQPNLALPFKSLGPVGLEIVEGREETGLCDQRQLLLCVSDNYFCA